jgi:hypothetical protein
VARAFAKAISGILARDDRTRPQDRADTVALLARATAPDLDAARRALELIHRRGFGHGRDLLGDFELIAGG